MSIFKSEGSSKFYEIKLPKKYINRIEITGNSITKDNTLRSKIEVEPGDLYSEFRMKKDIEAIKNLKYINDAKSEIVTKNDLKGCYIAIYT